MYLSQSVYEERAPSLRDGLMFFFLSCTSAHKTIYWICRQSSLEGKCSSSVAKPTTSMIECLIFMARKW